MRLVFKSRDIASKTSDDGRDVDGTARLVLHDFSCGTLLNFKTQRGEF